MATGGNTSAVAVGSRCPNCGRRAIVDGRCSACGSGEITRPQALVATTPSPVTIFNPVGTVLMPRPSAELTVPGLGRPTRLNPTTQVLDWFLGDSAVVRGRVIIVQQGSNEPMDFDPWRWVAIPVWGLVLLISPLAIAIIVWQTLGFLPALAVASCSLLVLRFMFSDRLFQSWYMTSALNGHYIVEPMPVTMIRLRMHDDREVQLRLKGQLIGGSVMEGDRIAASGAWRTGVLRVRRIDCERTGATIVPRQPRACGLALCGLCVLLVGGLWLYLAGVPWVCEEAHSFRSSIEQRIPNLQTDQNQQ